MDDRIGRKAIVVYDDIENRNVRTLKGTITEDSEFLISIIDDYEKEISIAKKDIRKIVIKNSNGGGQQ